MGLALTPDVGVVCLDLDGAYQEGHLTLEAQQTITRLGGYTERSVTSGVHVLLQGRIPGPVRRYLRKGPHESQELLAHSFVTVSGRRLDGSPRCIPCGQAVLDDLVRRAGSLRTHQPLPSPSGPSPVDGPDTAILEAARRSRGGHRFMALYDEGAWSEQGLGRSEADASLIAALLHFTGGDRTRTLRLFRASALYRAKTDRKASSDSRTYAELSVDNVAKFLGYAHR
ncbi:phage NrS-1 polymerase family protein [Deinococcus malanensis]|uniref:phage NrS-1 polymerase family protein n=1 Tax=Deinococcus malanensis TaxID=1706855 RepID=UPI00166E1DF9|nr:hypothetical protein [Deinococcus malanensis]